MGHAYDLEERTEKFAKQCRELIRQTPKDIPNIEDSKQLARASGSVAANYIEANEAISPKDFKFRIKVCRKESKGEPALAQSFTAIGRAVEYTKEFSQKRGN